MSSRKRVYGGSGRTVTPKLRAISGSPLSLAERRLSSLESGLANQKERPGAQGRDRRERDAAVARQVEREACERRPNEDRQHTARVHESDRRRGGIRTRTLGSRERHGEGKAGEEPEDERAERRDEQGPRDCEQQGADGRADEGGDGDATAAHSAREQPSRGPRDEADGEDEAAHQTGGRRAGALALEQRHDPVPGDDCKAERRGL